MLRTHKICGIVRSQTCVNVKNLNKKYLSSDADLPKQADVVVLGEYQFNLNANYDIIDNRVIN